MNLQPLHIEIGVAVLFLTPTALYRLHRAYQRSRLRFHRRADRTRRNAERMQRAQDRAAAVLAEARACNVPDTDPRYRRVMRNYYASQILTTGGDPYGALLACRWEVARAWREATDTDGGDAA